MTLALTFACSKESPEPETVLRPVRSVQVFASGGDRVREFAGVARSGTEARISFKVGGTIQRLAVDVGDRVTRNQPLARLDPADFSLQVEDAQASLVQAKAQARNTSANYDRVRDLYENRNASKQDLDQARAAEESAAAAVESAEKRLELAQRQLAYTRLDAPIDGSVAEVPVEVNENVQAGQTIVLLTSESDIEVSVAVPSVLITGIREGDPVTITFDALGAQRFDGHVTEVGVASTGMATTFPVTVRLDSSEEDIRSGMSAEVGFRFSSLDRSEQFYVPSAAVGEDREGRFLFVVEPSGEDGVGIVRRKAVTTGQLTAEGLGILSGLSDGEFVITAGMSKLVDGQRVRFRTDAGDERH